MFAAIYGRAAAPTARAASRALSERAAEKGGAEAAATTATTSASATATPLSLAGRVMQFIHSPTGPKTSHFWGPVTNGGISLATMKDMSKPPEKVSSNMTMALCVYSLLFTRFALMVRPQNMLLFACHATNGTVQLYQLQRVYGGVDLFYKPDERKEGIAAVLPEEK